MDVILTTIYDVRLVTPFIGILVAILIYKLSTKNHNYWKEKGVPFAKPYPFVGSLLDLLFKDFGDVEVERYTNLGRIYGFYEGNKACISVGEPEFVKNILVKDFQYFTNHRYMSTGDSVTDNLLPNLEGETWKRVRTIISPSFSTGKLKRMLSIFEECGGTLLQNLKMESAKSNSVDVLRIYGAYSMDVIASTAFSTKVDSHNNPDNKFVQMAKKAFGGGVNIKMLLVFLMPKYLKMLKLGFLNSGSNDFFKTVTLQIIEERKRTGQTRNDFLQLLMDTATELATEEKADEKTADITDNYVDGATNHPIFNGSSFKHLSMDELVAQCIIFFIAGYHSTATLLSIITHRLALQQDEQELAFKEIKEVLTETNGKLAYESLPKMKYLDNVISEAFRIESPAPKLERVCNSDYKLGDTGITIPKGMIVSIPVLAMHRDPEFFLEPEKFLPDRFNRGANEKIIPYTFLPFGAGPRNCVAMRFALMELKISLIYILSAFKIQKAHDTQVPLQLNRGFGTLNIKESKLKLEPRTDCPLKI